MVRSLARRAVAVEVFERNPIWHQRAGATVTYSVQPETRDENGPYHRWKLSLPARGERKIVIDYRPPPRKLPAKPAIKPRD